MIKLFKYFKSLIPVVLMVICFLAIQASLDLSLPDYTSRIVNVGIQQNGIEYVAPVAITEDTYNNLFTMLTEEENNYFKKYYDYDTTTYKTSSYVLNSNKKEVKEELEKILTKPLLISYMLSNNLASSYGYDPNMGLEGAYLLMDNIPDSIITQTGIMAIKDEYYKLGIDISKVQTNYILESGKKMLLISLAIMVVAILIGYMGSRIAAKIGKVLREKVFTKVLSFSSLEMKKFGTASLITRTTNDIQRIQNITPFLLRTLFYAPLMGIGGVIKTTSKSGSMGWIIFSAVALIIIAMIILCICVFPKFKILQNLIDKINLVSREILSGIPVIRAFNNEKHEEERFDEANSKFYKVDLFVGRAMALLSPLLALLMQLTCLAIVWRGVYQIDAGAMQVGDVMAYIQYTIHIIFSFVMIGLMSIMLPRAVVSAGRINEILETEVSIKDSKKRVEVTKGLVEFKNVCFRYPDAQEDVISEVSFVAKPGTTTAFIGSTGSGKSTLINLIPRFYDVTDGSILVDGINVKDIPLRTLRSMIGYVPQKGNLFTGTVKDNIKFGDHSKKITEEDILKASKISQSEEFIENLENKYDTLVSEGGTNVSGGQRQRLSIARAVALNPDIYIFDDSFSALDFKTDANLRKELSKVTKNSTVFIVAQRISTVLNADQIVVLNEGKVVGIGTHKELMNNCSVYKEIALSQLSEEELNNA